MRTDDADAGGVKVAQATCHREAGALALAAAVRGAVDACGLEAAVLVPVLLLLEARRGVRRGLSAGMGVALYTTATNLLTYLLTYCPGRKRRTTTTTASATTTRRLLLSWT